MTATVDSSYYKSSHHHVAKEVEFLVAKHKTELEEKQVEVELLQDQIVVLSEKNMEKNLLIDSMKEQHELAMQEKIMELKSMESRMVIKTNQHDEEVDILEATIQEKENDIIDLQARLNFTKADLFEVSSTLVQTQHKLHDLSTSWPYKFFLSAMKGCGVHYFSFGQNVIQLCACLTPSAYIYLQQPLLASRSPS